MQRAGVGKLEAVNHLGFTLGAERHRTFALLQFADLLRKRGAAVQQGEHVAVERVDLRAESQQFGGGRVG